MSKAKRAGARCWIEDCRVEGAQQIIKGRSSGRQRDDGEVRNWDKYTNFDEEQEYALKIQKIEKIYEDSNQKIEDYEKKFNEDEFVENTLKNEEILQGIEENAKKAEEATQILKDYSELLEGKKEILQ